MSRRLGRLAITGAGGRLGSALLAAAGADAVAWRRPDYDLEDAAAAARLLERDRPALVLHTAAWTDVDGCARDPALAMRRNASATDHLARACAAGGARLLVVSTNEVFDGGRTDGQGYAEDDVPRPRNAYGASKLAAEQAASAAYAGRQGLWIVRVAWLFGPPGNDFPRKIIAAADRLPADDPLPVVADEHGNPTSTRDLAAAILELLQVTRGGLFHLGDGRASRLEWAIATLELTRPGRRVRPISRDEFVRASDPPPWGVLDTDRAAALGVRSRPWREALRDDLAGEPGRDAAGPPQADRPPPTGTR